MPIAAQDVASGFQSGMAYALTGDLRRGVWLVMGLAATIVWFLALYAGLRFGQTMLPRRRRGTKTHPDSLPAVGLIASLFLVVLVSATISRHGMPFPVDTWLHRWSVLHRPDAVADVAIVVTTSATGIFAYPLAALAGWLAVTNRRHHLLGALAAVVALALVQLMRFAMAVAIGRARPPVADWAWHASGSAMPSGHTTTSAFVAALITYGFGSRWPEYRRIIAVAAVIWAVAVGASRIYLGVHWATDVAAGWLLVLVISTVISVALKTVARRAGTAALDGSPSGAP